MTEPTGRGDLVVVRHGATEWSTTRRHTGRTDIPLLSEGEEEARRAGAVLGGRPFALVLTSPLRRARQTCELAGYGAEAVVDDDLLEWDYGVFEGRTTAEIRGERPGWSIWDTDVPEGESLAQVAARADRVVARARAAPGDVIAFAHAHILRVLVARWCDLDAGAAQRFALETGSVSELGWEHDYPVLHCLNHT